VCGEERSELLKDLAKIFEENKLPLSPNFETA